MGKCKAIKVIKTDKLCYLSNKTKKLIQIEYKRDIQSNNLKKSRFSRKCRVICLDLIESIKLANNIR